MNVRLIVTDPAGSRGSMSRYANLIYQTLREHGENSNVSVTRLDLAGSWSGHPSLPRKTRNWAHHVSTFLNAITRSSNREKCVYHILDGSHAYLARCFQEHPLVITAHDIIPFLQMERKFPIAPPGKAAQWLIHKSIEGLKTADHVMADSRQTAQDLTQQAGVSQAQVSVIHPALSMPNIGPPGPASRSAKQAHYILHVGHDGFYKNRYGVIRTFSLINNQPALRLKMVGPPAGPEIAGLIAELELGARIDWVSEITDPELESLYAGASLLLFPSIYEGFGWPPLEAMASGCPVVCSNAASLPEVVGEAALTADPHDHIALAHHCQTVLNEPAVAHALRRKGFENIKRFSPDKMARELIQVYKHVAS